LPDNLAAMSFHVASYMLLSTLLVLAQGGLVTQRRAPAGRHHAILASSMSGQQHLTAALRNLRGDLSISGNISANASKAFGKVVSHASKTISASAIKTSVIGAAAPAAAGSSAPASGPASGPAASVGLCGCERKTQECTCGGWLEYLQCVSKKCMTGKCGGECPAHNESFMGQCEAVQRPECGDELEWTCGPHEATCQGKFHQLRDSMLGLEVNTEHLSDEAFCGPWGKCQGELRLAVDIHKPVPGLSIQCSMPLEANASFSDRSLWQACMGEVNETTSTAGCTLPMVPRLAAGAKLDGKCWLLKAGEKVSKNAWFVVQNRYDGDMTPVFEEHKKAQTEVLHKSRAPACAAVLLKAAGVVFAMLTLQSAATH